MPRRDSGAVDGLFGALLAAGEAPPTRIAQILTEHDPDEETLLGVLHRALPIHALEYLARTPPWSERSRVLAAIVLNPKAPPRLSLPLVPALLWRSLADVAVSPRVPSAVRLRAEAVLKEQLPDLRIGERITLARLATTPVLLALLSDADRRVLEACLQNPRLREVDLAAVVRRPDVSVALIETIGASRRWTETYIVRLEVALQPRTPLGIALAQISALTNRDLVRVSETKGVAVLVQAAARRVVEERGPR